MAKASTVWVNDEDGSVIDFTPYTTAGWVKYTGKAGRAAIVAGTRKKLLAFISPGDRVYTVLRSKSRSGMMRHISLLVVVPGDEWSKGKPYIRDITRLVGLLGDYSVADSGGLKMGGCGMDMGFQAVYNLGRDLWPLGTPEVHGTRNGEPDRDGGYALKHEWL